MTARAWLCLRTLALLVPLLLAGTAAQAQVEPAQAEALMRQSGLWTQMDSLAGQVRAGFAAATAQQGDKSTPAQAERVMRAIDLAFAPERLRADMKATLSQGLQAQHLQTVEAWYTSDLGQRIAAMDRQAGTRTDPVAVMQEGTLQLQAMPASRRAQLEQMVEVVQGAELLAGLAINTALAVQLGAQSVVPGAPGLPAQAMRDQLQLQRPRLVDTFRRLMLASTAASYAGLNDDEVARYLGFLKSAAGRHVTDVSMKAFEAAMVRASSELGRRLPGAMDAANT
jgi:hypothetical protein